MCDAAIHILLAHNSEVTRSKRVAGQCIKALAAAFIFAPLAQLD